MVIISGPAGIAFSHRHQLIPAHAALFVNSTRAPKPCTSDSSDSNPTCTPLETASSDKKPSTKLKDDAKLGWRVTQALLKRVTEVFDTNPAKLALNLAKLIIDVKNMYKDNIDATDRRIISIGLYLQAIGRALDGLSASSAAAAADFEWVLKEELEKLMELHRQSTLLKVADCEHQKTQIADIFERVNQARINFELYANLRLVRVPDTLDVMRKQSLASQLCPSAQAHHGYYFEGEEAENLRRVPCIPGTRVSILDDLVIWATDPSSEILYWLSGPAGSGKSTIAYTIARFFELVLDDDTTVLGGTFFCSRHYENTRLATRIVRTIVYQLAFKCQPFAEALLEIDITSLTINEDPRTQLQNLLIKPWRACQSACTNSSAKQYLIVLDALDEIAGDEGEAFLKCLLEVFTVEHMTGLKFLVTGRPNPKLETQVEQHHDKQLCRLHDVSREEVQTDIRRYYEACLKYQDPTGDVVERLVEQADGLFIYAATVIRSVEGFTQLEQSQFLTSLVNGSSLDDTTTHLHDFYLQILLHSFNKITGYVKQHRVDILRVISSTSESVSPATVCGLLGRETSAQEIEIVIDVVRRLHSVLYFQGGKILWYHKSFLDFIFAANPEGWFWHHSVERHDFLAERCFATMDRGLSFNMAGSGNLFDDIIVTPSDSSVDLCPALQYACQNWCTHLEFMRPRDHPGITQQQQGILSHFIINHSLSWIECMQLLNMAHQCPQMLHGILGFLDENSELAPLCARAIDFAFCYNCHLRFQSCQNPYAALMIYPCHEEPQLTWLARVESMNSHQPLTSSGSPRVWGVKLDVDEMIMDDDNSERYVSTQAKLALIDAHLARCNNVYDINIELGCVVPPVSCLIYSMDGPLHAIQQIHTTSAVKNAVKAISKGSWIIGSRPTGRKANRTLESGSVRHDIFSFRDELAFSVSIEGPLRYVCVWVINNCVSPSPGLWGEFDAECLRCHNCFWPDVVQWSKQPATSGEGNPGQKCYSVI
ncbi:hypothetical protein BJ165DRAFT_1483571 [Panaeolus papilionaceus]|nr:hypothetical protein BJ165DRAFT_1483571 [Panaeolus papilionaceus]